MFRVRRVGVEEAATIAALIGGLYHRKPSDPEGMEAMLADPKVLLLLAETAGECVGYLYGYLIHRLDGTQLLLIYDVTVGGEFRRRGIGSGLMREAFDHARLMGATGCWLIADEVNRGARAFYEHLQGEEWAASGFRWRVG